ncbi:MAG: 2-hydroxychromene-2-carboxylate isomerase [Pseudomonadota bacterium]
MGKVIDFYWDIGSTNSYFAYHLLKPIAAKHDAEIRYQPFNLGYVFRHHNYALMEEPRAKLTNRRRDLQRWAAHHKLPFRMPEVFPIKTSRVLRGALAMREHGLEEAYLDACFAAYWEAGDHTIAEYARLREIAESLGVNGEAFETACESDALRNSLAAVTDQAMEGGIFGAPTMVIDGEIYWGKDRFEFIDAHLAGQPALPPGRNPADDAIAEGIRGEN